MKKRSRRRGRQAYAETNCSTTGRRGRACRDLSPFEPARPNWGFTRGDRRRALFPPALRGRQCRSFFSRSKGIQAPRMPTAFSPPATGIWGGSRKHENGQATARGQYGGSARHQLYYLRIAEHRELFLSGLGLAVGRMSRTRRLAAILAADLAGYSEGRLQAPCPASNCPAGATFSQPGLQKSVGCSLHATACAGLRRGRARGAAPLVPR
jgi:hypothetical protein